MPRQNHPLSATHATGPKAKSANIYRRGAHAVARRKRLLLDSAARSAIRMPAPSAMARTLTTGILDNDKNMTAVASLSKTDACQGLQADAGTDGLLIIEIATVNSIIWACGNFYLCISRLSFDDNARNDILELQLITLSNSDESEVCSFRAHELDALERQHDAVLLRPLGPPITMLPVRLSLVPPPESTK